MTRAEGPLRGRLAIPLLALEDGDTRSLPSQAVAELLADVRRAEEHLRAGRYEEASLYARALARAERFGHEIVFVAARKKSPEATSAASYVPGEFEGRAYVWSFGEQRVVCVADVRAESSKRIGYAYSDALDAPAHLAKTASMKASVERDMRVQLERAIGDALASPAQNMHSGL